MGELRIVNNAGYLVSAWEDIPFQEGSLNDVTAVGQQLSFYRDEGHTNTIVVQMQLAAIPEHKFEIPDGDVTHVITYTGTVFRPYVHHKTIHGTQRNPPGETISTR